MVKEELALFGQHWGLGASKDHGLIDFGRTAERDTRCSLGGLPTTTDDEGASSGNSWQNLGDPRSANAAAKRRPTTPNVLPTSQIETLLMKL